MLDSVLAVNWRLLIYTVPATPSRKRAFVWRELKKVGAVYLRDGVAVVPDGANTTSVFDEVAATIEEFGGQAIVVADADLGPRTASLIEASRSARNDDYRELATEAGQLLTYIRSERPHRDFDPTELRELGGDLNKLRGWRRQIAARDYFQAAGREQADELLNACAAEVNALLRPARGPLIES